MVLLETLFMGSDFQRINGRRNEHLQQHRGIADRPLFGREAVIFLSRKRLPNSMFAFSG
jgi:hypothetical protein